MRHSRTKISPTEGAAAYRCISRTVNGEWLFDDVVKETYQPGGGGPCACQLQAHQLPSLLVPAPPGWAETENEKGARPASLNVQLTGS